MKKILGAEAKSFTRAAKWEMLSPFLKCYGREALAYATLQEGMEYFVTDRGYIAFTSIRHPVFAPRGRRIVLSDPICAEEDVPHLVQEFLADHPRVVFAVISEKCAEKLRPLGFKANCIGYEPEIPIQSYNTLGNWKELDLIKRSRNEARREGIVVREEQVEKLDRRLFDTISKEWIGTKKVNDREIWIYARRPVFEYEEDVRKFVAYNREREMVGFAFYDPIYREGRIIGYAANILRCDEKRYGRLATAIHMEAIERMRPEGKEVLNLMLAPFVNLDRGRFNDDFGCKAFFKISERFGNNIYNFKGLAFHKSKYRVPEKSLYFATNSLIPSNDIYLAFLSSDIARSYFGTLFQLISGILRETIRRPSRK